MEDGNDPSLSLSKLRSDDSYKGACVQMLGIQRDAQKKNPIDKIKVFKS